MRIILYTGKGGVGKTSIAAATAIMSAKQGRKTLVMSTDPAHSLGDSFDTKLSAEPLELQKNLWAQEIDSNYEMQSHWGVIQSYLEELLASNSLGSINIEELISFPGMEDLLSLMKILKYFEEKTYDAVIIDCAPTGETLSLLSYPEMLKWWMEKLFPIQRKVAGVLRPISKPVLGVKLPTNAVFDELQKLYDSLDQMRSVLLDKDMTSIRIVVNPEKMVIKEAERSFTYLNIFDFNVDCIVVNRIIPDTVNDSYFGVWKGIQSKYRERVKESFSPLPIYEVPLFEQEVVGFEMLERMGKEVFGNDDPVEVKFSIKTQEVKKDKAGYSFSIYMPFTQKDDLALSHKGDEILIKTDKLKKIITLPRTLINLPIKGAKFDKEHLIIRLGGDIDEQ